MNDKTQELIQECKRQSESCLYTSTAFYIWLRKLRWWRGFFIVTPLVLGGIASGKLLLFDGPNSKAIAAIAAFFAGLLPSIYSALKFDDKLRECTNAAAEFKNLQDRFRQAAQIAAQKPFAEFEKYFNELMNRMEIARKPSITPPEHIFKAAQNKIQSGDYSFDVDKPSEPKQ